MAYNRRYFGVVTRLSDMVSKDGGVSSARFDFSEKSSRVGGLDKPKAIMEN